MLETSKRRFDELNEAAINLRESLQTAKTEASGMSDPEALTQDIDQLTSAAEEMRAKLAEAMVSAQSELSVISAIIVCVILIVN